MSRYRGPQRSGAARTMAERRRGEAQVRQAAERARDAEWAALYAYAQQTREQDEQEMAAFLANAGILQAYVLSRLLPGYEFGFIDPYATPSPDSEDDDDHV